MKTSSRAKTSAKQPTFIARWQAALLVFALFVSLAVAMTSTGERRPIGSSETRFAEYSLNGLQIVPASCSGDPHYAGDCTAGSNDTPPAPSATVQCIQSPTFSVEVSAPGYGYTSMPGATGYFFDGMYTTYMSQAIDSTINFNPADTPIGNRSGGADSFSATWFGYVKADTSGSYGFHTVSDDGVSLRVDGNLIINNWTDHGTTENTGNISLTAGEWYPFRLDFYEKTGGSVITLSYTPPGGSKQIIPSTKLSSSGGPLSYIVDWGDGSALQTLPANGYADPEEVQTAQHNYSNLTGNEQVKVRAVNRGGFASNWTTVGLSCDNQCSPGYSCSGDDLMYTNSLCQQQFVQACVYGCTGSFPNAQCVAPPQAQFVPFTAYLAGPGGPGTGNSFQASGELEARPALVRQGETTQVYWNTQDMDECSVIGTDGFASDDLSSGANGQTSEAINEQTTFTLNCTGLDGNPVTDTAIVNIIPVVQEK